MTAVQPQPGDVLVTRSAGFAGRMIRFGAALRDQPNLCNHVAVVSHTDKAGTLWCLEGRPGGVGWRDAGDYLRSRWTVANTGQRKTPAQRTAVAKGALAMIGTPYDWEAIAADTAAALDLGALWQPRWGKAPGHVVCSSLAICLYARAGLDHPHAAGDGGGRETTPADWLAFIIGNGYQGQQ